MARVLVADKLEPAGVDILRAAGLEADARHGLTGDALREALAQADGAIVRSATRVTAELLDAAPKLRAVVRAGVGVDNIDVAAATRKGVVVMNTPGGNTVSTAEHTMALLLALARHVAAADASVRQGKWERGRFVGAQLAGRTLGVVGLGRVGREVARRAAAFDMKVVGFDPFVTPERVGQLGVAAAASLDALLPRCDFLTVHTPLTEQTRDLIGAVQLARLPKGAGVVNCARGGIINESALADALRSGHLAGAALDVFGEEPPPAGHPILGLPNVVVTPHLGASTVEAQESVAREAAQLMADFLTRGSVQFAVNMPALDRSELAELRPYVNMAWRLGLLHSQTAKGAIRRAELSYRGEVARWGTRLVTAAFAAGLLESRLEENVNAVNAELLTRERGIELVEEISPKKGDFGTLVQARLVTDRGENVAAATLFGKQFLRLVQLGPHRLDAYLDGNLLVLTHLDVPGLVGHIGTILGRHQVNIAQMTVGREVPGGEAIAVLNLDSAPPDEVLREVGDHPRVRSLELVKLPPAGRTPAWFG